MPKDLDHYRANARHVELAQPFDEDLGPLALLPGTWKNTGAFEGRGWNSIALPFAQPGSRLNYRLLVNQFNEELKFTLVDKGVPNRGIDELGAGANTDQLVVTLDYEQMIKQIAAADSPDSGLAGDPDLAIHHEPGLWLNMTNFTTNDFDVARLATIPHGNAALALGRSFVSDGAFVADDISGLPIGGPSTDLTHPYLAPYRTFDDAPFKGNVTADDFPGFNPVRPNALLAALPEDVRRTTTLHVDTTVEMAGIHNIPFIERQADAAEMQATFWIMEVGGLGPDAKLVMAYTQTVLLDFFPRADGEEGLIRWPHVSINVMEKAAEPDTEKAAMPAV